MRNFARYAWPAGHSVVKGPPVAIGRIHDNVMNGWIANPKRRESAGPWLDGATVPEAWKAKWRERLKQ